MGNGKHAPSLLASEDGLAIRSEAAQREVPETGVGESASAPRTARSAGSPHARVGMVAVATTPLFVR